MINTLDQDITRKSVYFWGNREAFKKLPNESCVVFYIANDTCQIEQVLVKHVSFFILKNSYCSVQCLIKKDPNLLIPIYTNSFAKYFTVSCYFPFIRDLNRTY